MSKRRALLAAALMLGASAAELRAQEPAVAAPAEAHLDLLLDTIRSNRKALVAVNLHLSDAEAAGFWPLYDRYQREIAAIGDRLARVVEDYTASFRDLSNEKAMKLIDDYLSAEADRAQVRRAYLPEFAKILPGRTVARLYQIENKLDAVIRYDLAAAIPVIEEEPSAPAK